MKTSTVLAAIEVVRPSVQEDAAVYFYPLIPEDVLNVHKKKYLDLEPNEKVLVLVNQKSGLRAIFSGFCITDKRLIVRVENGSVLLGELTSIFRETSSIPLEEIATVETIQNLNATARIIVNGQYLGLIYQDSQSQGLRRSNNHTFEAIDALFKEMLKVSATEDTPTIVDKNWAKRHKNSRKSMISKYFIDPICHHYCDFKGLASRADYWYFVLFNALITWSIVGLFNLFSLTAGTVINCILSLILLLPSLGITVRRLHDIGKKGTMIFIAFIPLVGVIWLIVLLCQKGVNPTQKQRSSFNLSDIIVCVLCACVITISVSVALTKAEYSSDTSEYTFSDVDDYADDADADDDKNIAKINKQVNKIYKEAFAHKTNVEKKYFSKNLYKKWQKNQEWEESTGYINIDFDIWTMSQDYDKPRCIIEDISTDDHVSYIVLLTIRDWSDQSVALQMIKEHGEWVIDDMLFVDSFQYLSELLQQ